MDEANPTGAQNTGAKKLAVFYNGACPFCAREIAFYRRRKGAESISWVDVSHLAAEDEVAPGLSKKDAHVRFHVRCADGTLVSGAEAFAGLWLALPGFRLWGRLFEALISTRPRDLRVSRVGYRERATAAGEKAGVAMQGVLFVRGIARLRPRALRPSLHGAVSSASEGGVQQSGGSPGS